MNRDDVVLLIGRGPLSMMRVALERAGFRVTSSTDSIHAVAAVALEREVSAIILDHLSSRSVHLVTYVRRRFPNAPLVSIEASGTEVVTDAVASMLQQRTRRIHNRRAS